MANRPPRLDRVFQCYDPPLYFVTFNTYKRQKLLDNVNVQDALVRLNEYLSSTISSARPHWQHGFFDHLIRHGESYAKKWEYVRQNPVQGRLSSPRG